MDFFQIVWITLVLLVTISWLRNRSSISPAIPLAAGQSVLDIEMEGAAERAVAEAWQRYQVDLDFSPASVQRLDQEILQALHQQRTQEALDDGEFSRNAMLWGAYLGEVLRREVAGDAHWQRDGNVAPQTFPVVLETGEQNLPYECFPCGWCVQRIQKGPAEAVWVKLEEILDANSQEQ